MILLISYCRNKEILAYSACSRDIGTVMPHPKYSDEESVNFDIGIDDLIEKFISREGLPPSLHIPVWDLLDRGGKRFRPILAYLSCKMFSNTDKGTHVIPFAAAVELLHNMTLVHDDIEDNSDERRGKPCLHRNYGIPIAINTADFMAIKVFEMITSQSIRAETRLILLQKVIERVKQMLHGQAIEIEIRESSVYDLATALEIIKCKTAALIILSSEIGTILGGGSDIQLKFIQRYAGYAGLAFQITDDLLNLIGEKKYGKEIGGDLREGKRTAIVGHFMSSASQEDKRIFLKYFGKKNSTTRQTKKQIALLHKHGSIEYAKKLADYYLKCGLYYLQFLPDNQARTSLVRLSKFLTNRNW